MHHIREECITREIHHHDIFHRILPIRDIQVLPARHYKLEEGRLVELGRHEIPPGQAGDWVIMETLSKDDGAPLERRRFTAREFPGTQGDAVQYVTPQGYPRSEQTWVHYPVLETGAHESGQTVPFVFH